MYRLSVSETPRLHPVSLAQKHRVVDLQVSVSPDLQCGSPGPNKQIPRVNKHISDPDNKKSELYMYLYCSSEQTVCLSQIKKSPIGPLAPERNHSPSRLFFSNFSLVCLGFFLWEISFIFSLFSSEGTS